MRVVELAPRIVEGLVHLAHARLQDAVEAQQDRRSHAAPLDLSDQLVQVDRGALAAVGRDLHVAARVDREELLAPVRDVVERLALLVVPGRHQLGFLMRAWEYRSTSGPGDAAGSGVFSSTPAAAPVILRNMSKIRPVKDMSTLLKGADSLLVLGSRERLRATGGNQLAALLPGKLAGLTRQLAGAVSAGAMGREAEHLGR